MAQTGFTPILLYASNTATSVPAAGNLTNSANGAELAVNTADKRLFTKNSGGSVVELGTNPSALTVAGTTTLSALTASTALALNASKEVVSVTNTGTGNNVLSAGPTLTGTIGAAALTLSSDLTLNGGTANGVLYLNGSKVATSSSAGLTYDGSNLGVGSAAGANARLFAYANDATLPTLVARQDGAAPIQVWQAGGSEVMRFTTGGNLGIGTSSPGAKLDVQTSGSTSALFTNGTTNQWAVKIIQSGSTELQLSPAITGNSGPSIRSVTSGGAAYAPLTLDGSTITLKYSGTAGVLLDSSGNLGIGTSSPAQKLHVRQDQAAYTWGRVDNQSSSASAYSGWMLGAFGNSWGIAIGSSAANSNALSFVIDAGGANTERMRLDASGNLGLGVTPSAWNSGYRVLEFGAGAALWAETGSNSNIWLSSNTTLNSGGSFIYKTTAAAAAYNSQTGIHRWYTAPSGTAGNAISFTQAMTLDASGQLLVGHTAALGGLTREVLVNTASGSAGINFSVAASLTARIRSESASTEIGTINSAPLIFNTANTEKARITSGGDLGVGETNPLYRLTVKKDTTSTVAWFENSNASAPNGPYVKFSAASPNNATQYFLYCEDSTAQRATIRSNGGLANYSANDVNLSDRREKTNFAPAKSYLDTICAIPVQTFNYIDQSEDDPGLTLGVVAQDVQAVAPELVMESNWGTEDNPKMRLSIYQTDLQYALMKCVQELKAQNDELRARVAALEAQP